MKLKELFCPLPVLLLYFILFYFFLCSCPISLLPVLLSWSCLILRISWYPLTFISGYQVSFNSAAYIVHSIVSDCFLGNLFPLCLRILAEHRPGVLNETSDRNSWLQIYTQEVFWQGSTVWNRGGIFTSLTTISVSAKSDSAKTYENKSSVFYFIIIIIIFSPILFSSFWDGDLGIWQNEVLQAFQAASSRGLAQAAFPQSCLAAVLRPWSLMELERFAILPCKEPSCQLFRMIT